MADQFALSDASRLRIFDTDHPNGDLVDWFPDNTQIINLGQTIDQVKLFDTMIGEPTNHYVVDLQSELHLKFFNIFHDIAFDEGAREAGIDVSVYFLLDRSTSSLQAARVVRSKLRCSEFVVVLNEAIGTLLHLTSVRENYQRIPKDREIALPRLSAEARAVFEQPGFSFADFVAGGSGSVSSDVRFELWNLLELIYNQRSPA